MYISERKGNSIIARCKLFTKNLQIPGNEEGVIVWAGKAEIEGTNLVRVLNWKLKLLHTIKVDAGRILCAIFLTKKLITFGSERRTLFSVNLESKSITKHKFTNGGEIRDICKVEENIVITGHDNKPQLNVVQIVDEIEGISTERMLNIHMESSVYALCKLQNPSQSVCAGCRNGVQIINYKTSQILQELKTTYSVTCVITALGSSHTLIFAQYTGKLNIWDHLQNKITEIENSLYYENLVSKSLCQIYPKKLIYSGEKRLYSIHLEGTVERELTIQSPCFCLAKYSKNMIICGNFGDCFDLYDARTFTLIKRVKGVHFTFTIGTHYML